MKLSAIVVFCLAGAGCAARSPVKSAREFEFRNVRIQDDGRRTCAVGSTAIDAKTGNTIIFCK